jgi:hypothetical protein
MEEILKRQIEELEKLVKIQNEVIIALKSQQTIQVQYVPSYQQQYYQQWPQYNYPWSGTYIGIQGAGGTQGCISGGDVNLQTQGYNQLGGLAQNVTSIVK